MKWATLGLVALGTVAATGAAVLVAALPGSVPSVSRTSELADVPVAVAVRDLPAMSVLSGHDVEIHFVSPEGAPAGAYRDSVQVIGRVLSVAVRTGQALAPADFVSDGSALRLAAALPDGRRAVTINLRDALGSEGLLFPGCLVDVLASMRVPSQAGDQPVTVTLLQGVPVLAVGARTIVSPDATGMEAVQVTRANDRPAVTLLLDAHDAEKLKLAMEEGSVSLVLRSPHDRQRGPVPGADLATLSPALVPAPVPGVEPAASSAPALHRPLQRNWEAVVLRGAERELRSFELPAAGQP